MSTSSGALSSGSGGGEDTASGVVGESVEASKLGGDEDFVPDFGVPDGVSIPSSYRQHIMVVGTARTAVRSPQVRNTNFIFFPGIFFLCGVCMGS